MKKNKGETVFFIQKIKKVFGDNNFRPCKKSHLNTKTRHKGAP